MNATTNLDSRRDAAGNFKPLLDLATSDLYDRNAFRLLEVHVEATERDLAKRKQLMEVAARNQLPVPAGSCRILPRTPVPDDHEVRECAHAIQDAERRLAHEFFWFWPLVAGQAGQDAALRLLHQGDSDGAVKLWRGREGSVEEGPAAKHNLAVLHHFSALEVEKSLFNGGGTDPARAAEAERYWAEANRYWRMVSVEQSCWSWVTARIRAMDDQSLTTGAARRLEGRLPVALTLIQARLAIRAHQNQKPQHAQRHVARIRGSGFASEAMAEALRIAVEPVRAQIKTLCEAATRDGEADAAKADTVVERLLEQTAGPLGLLDLLLPADHPARIAEHDQVALAGLSSQIDFGNKTESWKRSLELLNRLVSLAASTAARERIAQNRKIVQDNFDAGVCWFCGLNPGGDKCAVEMEMHGEVQHISIPGGTRVTWRHLKLKIPRCPDCRKESGGSVVAVGCIGAVLGIIVWITMGNYDLAGAGFVIGLILALIIGVVGRIKIRKHYRKGITKRSTDEYPRLKRLRQEGWKAGAKPAGVQ